MYKWDYLFSVKGYKPESMDQMTKLLKMPACFMTIFMAILSSSPSFAKEQAEWPMFMKDPIHFSYYKSEIALPLHLKWKFRTDGPIYSSPVVGDGLVIFGSHDNNIYALDAINGELRWRYATGGQITAAPCIGDGIVYVSSKDKLLYALDIRSGEPIWKFETGGIAVSSPILANGILYFGSNDNYLYAIEASTGKLFWRVLIEDYKWGGVYSSPAVGSGLVYIAAKNASVYALNVFNGKEVWRFRADSAIYSSPSLNGGSLYIGSYDHKLYSLDAGNGNLKWKADLNDWVYATPLILNGAVYAGTKEGNLYSFDTEGKRRWMFKIGTGISSSMAGSAGGLGFIGTEDGYFNSIDLKTGEIKWSMKTDGGILSSPALANNMVYIGSKDSYLYAFSGTLPEKPVNKVHVEESSTPAPPKDKVVNPVKAPKKGR